MANSVASDYNRWVGNVGGRDNQDRSATDGHRQEMTIVKHTLFTLAAMRRPATRSAWLVAFAAFQCGASLVLAGGKLPAPSNQHPEAAERAVTQLRAKRDELADRLQTAEQKLQDAANRLGLSSDPRIVALTDGIQKATARAKALQTAFKQISPGAFNTLAEMVEHDRLTDQRKAMAHEAKQLEAQSQAATQERRDLIRQLVRRDPQGAALADAWETVRVQLEAANRDFSQAQARQLQVEAGRRPGRETGQAGPATTRGPPLRRPAGRRCGGAAGRVSRSAIPRPACGSWASGFFRG